MKKVLNFLKRNIAIHMVVGAWLGVMGAVYVIYSNAEVSSGLSAGSVAISKTNMSEVPEATLQSALDYLYEKASHVGEEGCPSGYAYNNNLLGFSCMQEPGFTVEWATSKTYQGIVYLNPTDLTATCNATLASQNLNNKSTPTPTEVKDGCMKWYIYGTDTNNDYLAILDHNTTAIVQWDTTGIYGTNVAFENSIAYSYLTDLTKPVAQGGSGWVVTPKIISGQEIADLTQNGSWSASSSHYYFGSNGTTSYSSMNATQKAKQQSFAWLFDYTDGCTSTGCSVADPNYYNLANSTSTTNKSSGYWKSTPYGTAGADYEVWFVNSRGNLYNDYANNNRAGLCPVITLSRAIIS